MIQSWWSIFIMQSADTALLNRLILFSPFTFFKWEPSGNTSPTLVNCSYAFELAFLCAAALYSLGIYAGCAQQISST